MMNLISENTNIVSYAELQLRINDLRNVKKQEEADLKNTFSVFKQSLNPTSILKKTIHNLTQDKEVQGDIIKSGLNMGVDILINKFFGKYSSVKGFINSTIAENIYSKFNTSNTFKTILDVYSTWVKSNKKVDS